MVVAGWSGLSQPGWTCPLYPLRRAAVTVSSRCSESLVRIQHSHTFSRMDHTKALITRILVLRLGLLLVKNAFHFLKSCHRVSDSLFDFRVTLAIWDDSKTKVFHGVYVFDSFTGYIAL
ncbi:hypothetical protein PoB_000615800 [Plakobranchus ocellatus]|uniref:Uncharacterized protein n=1 Tax=Plakobranchus ocellatus TaxID=259542 RepID=A0AAV3YAX0_9GAST|nr:hypothetical protein PoB_000615800 [Plakobranchus ocellatus]